MTKMLDAALDYSARGWPVFPCNRNKTPRTSNGFYDASTDAEKIKEWWGKWPTASIGVPTGAVSGCVVFDIDPDKGGEDSLHEITQLYEALPETVESITGGGGKHYFFKHPGVHIPPSASQLGSGLDIRGDGGYVILPPSHHPSGQRYEWELSSHPDDTPLADMPIWLRALTREHENKERVKPGQPIAAGQRNDTLMRLAGQMRRVGWGADAISAALSSENAKNCQPPLPEHEVENIANSISRYAPEAQKDAEARANGQAVVVDDEALPTTSYGDVFNAEALVSRHGDKLRYCKEWGCWYIWKDTHWVKDRQDEVFDYARDTIRWMAHIAFDTDNEKLIKHLVKSRSDRALQNMLHQAGTMRVRRLPEHFDRHRWFLNCANGTVDLKSAQLMEHDSSHLITKCTQVAYNPGAECERWELFLAQIMGAEPVTDDPDATAADMERQDQANRTAQEMSDFLQRCIGYTLVGSTQEKILLIPWGVGDNGKSTFIETMSDILGSDYALRTPAALFLSKRDNAIPNDVAQLKGIRFAYAAEPPQDRRLDESLIKELTGGDTVSARFMRGEFFQFRPECTLWMSTNHKPPTHDTGNALWNRIKLIPFNVTIPKADQDTNLHDKLVLESEGILAWAIRGCLEWQKGGLAEPDQVKNATDRYRNENDTLGLFIEEKCLVDTNVRARSSELYESYKKWCDLSGERFVSQKNLTNAMKEKGYDVFRSNGTWYLGIGLSDTLDRTEPVS